MPEPAAAPTAERRRLARQADRRREAARMLALVECTARYGASALANGASPDAAAEAAVFVAEQLEAMAVGCGGWPRRMARPSGERTPGGWPRSACRTRRSPGGSGSASGACGTTWPGVRTAPCSG